jgi:type IV secretion system protein VirB10
MAGLADRTDHHWGHMVKAALVSTLLGVGAELGANAEDRLVRAVRVGAQDSVNETGRQLVERQLGIAPTIIIRPGLMLRVIVTRDLILEPLEGKAR